MRHSNESLRLWDCPILNPRRSLYSAIELYGVSTIPSDREGFLHAAISPAEERSCRVCQGFSSPVGRNDTMWQPLAYPIVQRL